MATEETERFTMTAPKSWVKKLEIWRENQSYKPNRSLAIRILVLSALDQQPKQRSKKRGK